MRMSSLFAVNTCLVFLWQSGQLFITVVGQNRIAVACRTDTDCVKEGVEVNSDIEGGHFVVTSKVVDNTTFCCAEPYDYVDLKQWASDNVTCNCRTAGQAAAEYADKTMGVGRACQSGTDCSDAINKVNVGRNLTFCCLGESSQHAITTYFSAEEIVCRCFGGSPPSVKTGSYVLPETNNASSSGERCAYNHDCAHYPSARCMADNATFCCYGSRGIETMNDPEMSNVTRCTCTNTYQGNMCAADPNPVPYSPKVGTHECRSGDACKSTSDEYSCFHGDTVFCCPQQGLRLTIVNNAIAACTCISAGGFCNVTFTSSGSSFAVAHFYSYPMVTVYATLLMWDYGLFGHGL